MLNPPTTEGLCGDRRHPASWLQLAAQARLPASDWRPGTPPAGEHGSWAWAVGEQVVGEALPAVHHRALVRLADLAQTPLVGVLVVADGDEVTVAQASACPPLRPGGPALLDALAEAMAGP